MLEPGSCGVRARVATALLALGVVAGCGEASRNPSRESPATGGTSAGAAGEVGVAGQAGFGGTAGSLLTAGANAGGAAPTEDPCPIPLADWEPVQGDVFVGAGNMVATHKYAVASTDTDTVLLPIAEQAPEAMVSPIPIDASIRSPEAAWDGDDGALYVLGAAQTGFLLARVEASGHATTVNIQGAFSVPGRGAVAQAGQRVAVSGGDGSGNFVVHLFDDDLGPIKSFTLPKHGFGSLTSDAEGLRLAVTDSAAKTLEIYRITDAELTLLRTEPLASLPFPFTLAWAGDSAVLEIGDQLVLVDPSGKQATFAPPTKDGTSGIYRLTVTSSALGDVLGADVSNAPFVGRLRDGVLEWAGPGEQCVFSDVRADDQSIGVYYVRTLGPRTLAYFGFKCPARAP